MLEERPFLAITSHPVGNTPVVVTADATVRGIVDDRNNNVRRWELVLRPMSETGTTFDQIIASGADEMGKAPSTAVVLGKISPTLLQNGLYRLFLRAWEQNQTDADAPTEAPGAMIQVKTDAKLGDLTLPFQNLTIDVPGGSPIVVRHFTIRRWRM